MTCEIPEIFERNINGITQHQEVDIGGIRIKALPSRYNSGTMRFTAESQETKLFVKVGCHDASILGRMRHEMAWHLNAQSHPSKIADISMPLVAHIDASNFVALFYPLEQNARTLRDLIFDADIPIDSVFEIVKEIFLALRINMQDAATPCDNAFSERLRERLRLRWRELLCSLNGDVLFDPSSPISFNGAPPLSLCEIYRYGHRIIEELAHSNYRLVGLAHGDLHPENILIAGSAPRLIDGNNQWGIFPLYDLGKLWQSFDGLYDLCHSGEFELQYHSKYSIDISFDFRKTERCRSMRTMLGDYILTLAKTTSSTDVLRQVRRMTLLHFLALLPHHVRDKNKYASLLCRTFSSYAAVIGR